MRIAPLRWTPSSHKYSFATSGIVVLLLTSAIVISGISGESQGKIDYRRQSIDDDELHDEEIFHAVVQSLTQWQQRREHRVHSNSISNDTHHRVKRDEEIVCYGELGCFRDEGPFDYLDMLPSPPEEIGTKFLLFSRQNRQAPEVFSYFNFTSIYGSHFNASLPTKVIIHGFGSTCNRIWASEMRLALLSVVECNVICVDWENGAAMPNYVRAAVNTRLVGKQVALLILWLNDHVGSRTQDYHLIGFSLGAHVAGFAGQELKNLSRITGLDPAGPLFESYDSKVRLDTEDALFVDVIHSNGDSLLMGGLGSWEPMGHVDFYPNGGRVQKGCSNLFLGAVRDFLWSASDGDGRSLCNHRRAYKFFTESVSPRCPFPAFACDSYDKFLTGSCFTWDVQHCGNMGYYADQLPHRKKGILYLVTREDEPFCANQFRITIESSPSPAPVITYGGLESILIGHDFINETFLMTQTVKDNMVAGSVLQRLIVAHPALAEPVKVQLKYTAYNGWLYSGISRWSMDRLIITNAYGKSWSFCSRGLLLPSGIPVTVTLSPGVCINGYPGGNGLMTPSRPIYPPYPYEHFPTQPSDNNALQLSQHGAENNTITSTNIPGVYKPMDMNTDLDIDTSMKPPAVVTAGNVGPQDEIGPMYQLQATEVDWSQWQPLSPSPALMAGIDMNSNSHKNSNNMNNPNKDNAIQENFHENKFQFTGGTPVEAYPPMDEYDEDPTLQQSAVMADMESMTMAPSEEDATESEAVPTEVPEVQGTAESTEITNSNTSSVSKVVKIRICHMVPSQGNNESFSGDSNDFGEGRKLACVDAPPDSVVPASMHPVPISTDSENKSTIANNDLRGSGNADEGTVANAENPEAIRNELLNSIPVPPQSFWTAMQHNNTPNAMTQHQGADPDVVLPPHLQYILQQLDSQGFGPKSADTQTNFRQNGNKNRGLIPSSRALKPRPVLLSTRRQAKTIDAPASPAGNSPGNHNNNNHNNMNHNLNLPPKLMGGSMMGPILGPNPHSVHHPHDGRFPGPQQGLMHGHHVTVVGPAPSQMQPQMAQSQGIQSIIVAPMVHGESNQRSFARRIPGPLSILPPPLQVSNRPSQGHNSVSQQIPPQAPIQLSKNGLINGHNQNMHGNNHQNHGRGLGMHHNAQPAPSFVTKHKGGYYFVPYYTFDRPAMLIPRRMIGTNRRPLPSPAPTPGHLIQLPGSAGGGHGNNLVTGHNNKIVNNHNSNIVNSHNNNLANGHNNNIVNNHGQNIANAATNHNSNVANNHNNIPNHHQSNAPGVNSNQYGSNQNSNANGQNNNVVTSHNRNSNVGSSHNNNAVSNHNNNVVSSYKGNLASNPSNNVINHHNSNFASNPNSNVAINPNSNVAINPSSNVAINPSSNVAINPSSNIVSNHNSNIVSNHNSNVASNPNSNMANIRNGNIVNNQNMHVPNSQNHVANSHSSNIGNDQHIHAPNRNHMANSHSNSNGNDQNIHTPNNHNLIARSHSSNSGNGQNVLVPTNPNSHVASNQNSQVPNSYNNLGNNYNSNVANSPNIPTNYNNNVPNNHHTASNDYNNNVVSSHNSAGNNNNNNAPGELNGIIVTANSQKNSIAVHHASNVPSENDYHFTNSQIGSNNLMANNQSRSNSNVGNYQNRNSNNAAHNQSVTISNGASNQSGSISNLASTQSGSISDVASNQSGSNSNVASNQSRSNSDVASNQSGGTSNVVNNQNGSSNNAGTSSNADTNAINSQRSNQASSQSISVSKSHNSNLTSNHSSNAPNSHNTNVADGQDSSVDNIVAVKAVVIGQTSAANGGTNSQSGMNNDKSSNPKSSMGASGGETQYYEDFAPRGLSSGPSSHGNRPPLTIQ